MTEDEQRSIGLQTALVQQRMIRRELLTVARVEEPETQLASISARIGGRIDKLLMDFTGQPVRRGQPTAEIYSPEILSSAEEYKLAIENRKRLAGSTESQAISGADERPNYGGACLCLRRRRHPGPRLLPIRQQAIQRSGALRS